MAFSHSRARELPVPAVERLPKHVDQPVLAANLPPGGIDAEVVELAGLVRGAPRYATARGTRYRYYQTWVDDLDDDRIEGKDSKGWRLPAKEIEPRIGSIVEDRSVMSAQATAAGAGIDEVEALLRVTAQSSVDDRLAWVERVQLSSDQIRISIALPRQTIDKT